MISNRRQLEIACFLRASDKLSEQEREFVTEMALRLLSPRITVKQCEYLCHLFQKVGGKVI
jgi:hypothetical protein